MSFANAAAEFSTTMKEMTTKYGPQTTVSRPCSLQNPFILLTINTVYAAWVHSMERAHEIHLKEVEEEVARKGYYWNRGIKVPYEPSRQLGEASESLVKQEMP